LFEAEQVKAGTDKGGNWRKSGALFLPGGYSWLRNSILHPTIRTPQIPKTRPLPMPKCTPGWKPD
jgi:hypothetical protein